MSNTTTAPAGVVSSEQLGRVPRWYCLSADGAATLCVDEEDAKEVAAESWVMYPQNAPYRAAQMVDASAVAAAVAEEREIWVPLVTRMRDVFVDVDFDHWPEMLADQAWCLSECKRLLPNTPAETRQTAQEGNP